MNLDEVIQLLEWPSKERSDGHKNDYKGNIKGSYKEKHKTLYDYSDNHSEGSERLYTQIQNICVREFDTYVSRSKIKTFCNSEEAKKIGKHISNSADHIFGSGGDDNQKKRAYLYGTIAKVFAKRLSEKHKSKGIKELL